jgi:methionyl-tRNA synthetase
MTDRYYVTTPIYYVNDKPHIGHAYTTIAADAFARYYKLRGRRTRFLTGTDEHGLKLETAAKSAGKGVQQFVDEVSQTFRQLWPKLLCEPDDFIRTTEPRHERGAQELWKRCAANGDIYLGHFEGLYCVGCEGYKTEKELLPGNLCPLHPNRQVELVKEPSYFFRLSKYGDRLIKLYESRPELIEPDVRRNEVLSFLREGLKDISVSRTSFKWGIPVPGDPAHVMYVWFDALANYLTALGEGEFRQTFWPPDAHLIAKDILRFHTVYWQAFLLSAGYSEVELPRKVFSHGFLTINGQKIGKSLGNAIDPVHLAEYFGPDEVRYYLMREVSFGQDGDFSHLGVVSRIRAELSGTLGNLLHRTLGAFVTKHFDGKVPLPDASAERDVDRALRAEAARVTAEVAAAWERYEPHRATELAMGLAAAGNKYFDDCAPWALAKQPAERARLGVVIYHVLETLRIVSVLLWPTLPRKMDALRGQLGLDPVAPRAGLDLWPLAWGGLAPHAAVAPAAPVFRNFTKDDEAQVRRDFDLDAAPAPAPAPAPAAVASTPNSGGATTAAGPNRSGTTPPTPPAASPLPLGVIEYGDFAKVELRLGHVKSAERIPKKDKLLRLAVDLGEAAGPRTIIAGIALAYAPEALVGKQLVIVSNLAPRDFGKGLVSYGMLLACGPSESLSIVTVEKPMPAGTPVK